MLLVRPYPLACVLLAALAACGGDEPEPGTVPLGPSSSGTPAGASGGASSGGSGGASSGASGASGGSSGGTSGSSSGTSATAQRTATISWNGTTSTVEASVTRHFLQGQPLDRTLNVPKSPVYEENVARMACGPASTPEKGGRTITVSSLNLAGGYGGSCSGNPARITGAEQNIASFAGNQCNGRASCSYNPFDAFETYLGECASSNVVYGWQYRCQSLVFAPAFTLAAEADGHTFMIGGMDGAGSASSLERSARYFVDGLEYVVDSSAEVDGLTLSARTERTLEGSLEVALKPKDQPTAAAQTLRVSFQDEDNEVRQVALVHMGNDICSHAGVARGVRTIEGVEAKVFGTIDQTLACLANPARTVPGFELLRFPEGSQKGHCGAGEFRLRMKSGDVIKETRQDSSCRSFLISDEEERFSAEFYNVTFCAAGETDCETRAVVALSADERSTP